MRYIKNMIKISIKVEINLYLVFNFNIIKLAFLTISQLNIKYGRRYKQEMWVTKTYLIIFHEFNFQYMKLFYGFSGKGYFFSWKNPPTKGVEQDWLSARNFCRKRCMDLVSLETSAENEWIKKHIVDDKVSVTLNFFFQINKLMA